MSKLGRRKRTGKTYNESRGHRRKYERILQSCGKEYAAAWKAGDPLPNNHPGGRMTAKKMLALFKAPTIVDPSSPFMKEHAGIIGHLVGSGYLSRITDKQGVVRMTPLGKKL